MKIHLLSDKSSSTVLQGERVTERHFPSCLKLTILAIDLPRLNAIYLAPGPQNEYGYRNRQWLINTASEVALVLSKPSAILA